MGDYYSDRLSADRLRHCYEVAPARTQQYLQAELDFLLTVVPKGGSILELGCGYGRVLEPLTWVADSVVGIDTSWSSLVLAQEALADRAGCFLACMDAAGLAFRNNLFDAVVCIQNGISAFHIDQRQLIVESLRVTKPGGQALFSTYSQLFWVDRLEWFEAQAKAGLVGEIDHKRTGDGSIVCKDGFTATTVSEEQFCALTTGLNAAIELNEVDESSLFCRLTKGKGGLGILNS